MQDSGQADKTKNLIKIKVCIQIPAKTNLHFNENRNDTHVFTETNFVAI